MKVISIKEKNEIDIKEIELVAKEMKNGKIAIFPTETVYGIGANALDTNACKKIFEIKGRNENKPLIVLISDLNMLNEIVENINEVEHKLMKTFWPGALTIIFNKKGTCKIPDVVTGGEKSIGIRMTSGEIVRLLVQKAGVPIVAPSANLSGNPTGINPEEIQKELGNQVDYMIDCGKIDSDLTSTVVKVEENKIRILREGKISKEELEKIAEIKI